MALVKAKVKAHHAAHVVVVEDDGDEIHVVIPNNAATPAVGDVIEFSLDEGSHHGFYSPKPAAVVPVRGDTSALEKQLSTLANERNALETAHNALVSKLNESANDAETKINRIDELEKQLSEAEQQLTALKAKAAKK